MSTTPSVFELPPPGDDAASVLARFRTARQFEDALAREAMKDAAAFAAMHSTDSRVEPVEEWQEKALPVGGEGCPEVAEWAAVEFAAVLGRSTESGRRYLARAVEARHRLPFCWARMVAGDLPAWRLARIADSTMCLPPDGARYVDQHLAPVAHKTGPAELDRITAAAKALHDPEAAERDRVSAAEGRHATLAFHDLTIDGTVAMHAELDLADALDLEAALAATATERLRLGSTASLDVRRSQALGDLARGDTALRLDHGEKPARQSRTVVLHAHLSAAALNGASGLARVEEAVSAVTAEQVRLWCGAPDTKVVVKPVVDLDGHGHTVGYAPTGRLREQAELRDRHCVFPYCTRTARKCDLDHRVPHEHDGPTCSCNLAPLCRRHHRAKTHSSWGYTAIEPGTYLWRSPLGYQFLRDPVGTLDVTPDDDRRRLAATFSRHLCRDEPDEP